MEYTRQKKINIYKIKYGERERREGEMERGRKGGREKRGEEWMEGGREMRERREEGRDEKEGVI